MIHGARFSNAHLSSVDQGRNVGEIRITVANEPPRTGRLIDRGFENPPAGRLVARLRHLLNFNTNTPSARGQTFESRVGDVPAAIEVYKVSERQGESKALTRIADRTELSVRTISTCAR